MEKQKVSVLGTEYLIEPRELKEENIDGFTDTSCKLIVCSRKKDWLCKDNQRGK